MYLLYKCIAGALIMLCVHFLVKSNIYYLTGLVVLFPIFSIPAYYFMFHEKGPLEIQKTNVFALCSLIAYVGFVLTVFFTVKRVGIATSLLLSTIVWFVLAITLLFVWKRLGYA